MGGLFDSGTKQVQQQPVTTALPASEVSRLSAITGQQQAAANRKRLPPKTVLGTPVQPVGNSSPSTFGSY
jgi:hypothetical protein